MGALLDQKQQEAHEEGRASASSKKARELGAEEAVEDTPAARPLVKPGPPKELQEELGKNWNWKN